MITHCVNEFQKSKEYGDESFIIPPPLSPPFIFVEIPYWELNEIKSKHFLQKFHKFNNNSFKMVIQYFPLKEKDDYKSCVIYKGDCSCGSRHIGETKHNVEVRQNEHDNPTKMVRTTRTSLKQHQPLFHMGCHFKCSKKC